MAAVDQDGIRRVAERMAQQLLAGNDPALSGEAAIVARTVATVIADNFKTGAEIDRLARKQLDSLGREARDMDQAKLLMGIRQHLAKQKGFVL